MTRRRIAIIGSGGAGLGTAWLLQDDADVTVFERDPTPGGHAATVEVDTVRGPVYVELGFRYIFPWTYPNLTALLQAIGVTPRQNLASMSFRGPVGGPTLSVPPASMTQASRLAARASNIGRAVSFAWFLRAGRQILRAKDWGPSLDQYLAQSRIPQDIIDQYLIPALAAAWGAPVAAMGSFPAYDVLRVMQQGKAGMPHFYDVPGGASAYVTALLADSPNIRLSLSTEVTRLERDSGGWRLHGAAGQQLERFDAVVIATPAESAATLLEGAGHALAETVRGFNHFDTDIVVHRDFRLMPPERDAWAMINVRYDGRHAWTTEWAGRDLDVHVFRTWLPPGHSLPMGTVARKQFRHLIVDGASRKRQQDIAERQGEDGIYLAGMYTCSVDNHESATTSAVHLGTLMAPLSPRLRLLEALRRAGWQAATTPAPILREGASHAAL